ncbi:MAG: energy-coupling factor ABC transporter ATP-binding protein [Lachnospiraceae bacterium]
MLQFEQVCISYDHKHKILEKLSFHIKPGEQVGLIGANGAGKSTLLKGALGLLPWEGRILVDQIPLKKENLAVIRKKLGYVLQDSDNQMFMPTVQEDMLFGLLNYGMSRIQAERVVDETLEALGLEHLKQCHNHKLSGGEKKMAAIATILAMKPEALLMDEPSAALDPRNRRNLIRILPKLPQTKLIASHDLDLILEICDRVILLDHGQIVADGPTQEILRDQALLEAHGLELPFCLTGLPEKLRNAQK